MGKGFKTIKQVLGRFDDRKDKYISREWQAYAVKLAEELNDKKHISLYMKLARDTDRKVLERAKSFVKDAKARSKMRLFMWKVGQINKEKRQQIKTDNPSSLKLRRT